MKLWNRTQFNLTEEAVTNIRKTKIDDKRNGAQAFHSFKLTIWSEPDNSGYCKITFNPRTNEGLFIDDQRVVNSRLREAGNGYQFGLRWSMTKHQGWFYNVLPVTFLPKKGERFTNSAVQVARTVAQSLGLTGRILDEYVARFTVSQGIRARYKGKWLGLADYLRKKHHLPCLVGTRWSDTSCH